MPDCAEAGGNGVSGEIKQESNKASPSAACDLYRRSAGLLGCIQLRGRGMAGGDVDMFEVADFPLRMRRLVRVGMLLIVA